MHKVEFDLKHEADIKDWIHYIISANKRDIESINIIFADDAYLLKLNQTHLEHDYFTDILTFPLHANDEDPLHADIFISVARVKDNASRYHASFEDELHRVIIHGILHLLGFEDHSDEDKAFMRKQEDLALSLRKFS